MKNIVLIGMPSSGKTTIGKILAESLGIDFIDTDEAIRRMENRALSDIVNEDGLDKFLEIQEAAVTGLDLKGCIVATGGSIVYSEASMEHLKRNGLVVFLKVEFEEIERRITTKRRFARSSGQTLYDLYKERMPLYEKYADHVVECRGKTAEEIAAVIVGCIKKSD